MGLIDQLRLYIMLKFEERRQFVNKFKGNLGPKVQEKLEKYKKRSNDCITQRAGDCFFEVRSIYGEQYTVNLKER